MLAREVSSRAYPEIGVSDSHHPLSHHQNEAAKLERLHKINEYHMQQFAHLVCKLAAIPEGDGMMLDHTLLMYGTGISDSNTHFHDDLPIAVIGGKAAGVTGGRYVRYADGTPLANLEGHPVGQAWRPCREVRRRGRTAEQPGRPDAFGRLALRGAPAAPPAPRDLHAELGFRPIGHPTRHSCTASGDLGQSGRAKT